MNFGGTIRLSKLGLCTAGILIFISLLYLASNYQKNTNKVNLKNLLIASIECAIKGGREVVEVRKGNQLNERSKGKTKEGANNPVTSADERSHCAMYYSLVHTFPKVKVVSEETSSEADCRHLQTLDLDVNVLQNNIELSDLDVEAEDVTVWIDPLDATQEFTENLLEYVTTMVCVAVKGEPVIGVIHKPFGKPVTSWAWVGYGVSKDLEEPKNSDEGLTVIVSRSHAGKVKAMAVKSFGERVNIITAGGAGYKSLELARGNVSVYVHVTEIKKWDICAGNAVLLATKGMMTTLTNEKIDYSYLSNVVNKNGVLASSASQHDDFIAKFNGGEGL